jgi:hypothetical protein
MGLSLMIATLIFALLLVKDFSVNDQDQQTIQGVCDIAAASPGLNRDIRAQVAAWCVGWERRVQDANKPEMPPTPSPTAPK